MKYTHYMGKKFKTAAAAAIMAAVFSVCAVMPVFAGAKYVKVTGNPVNVRSNAGYSSTVIGKAHKGDQYTYIGEKKDSSGKLWYNVQFSKSKKGWILAGLAKTVDDETPSKETTASTQSTTSATAATDAPTTAPTTAVPTTAGATATTTTTKKAESVKQVQITANPVNVRSGAGTSYSKIGKTSKGKTFKYLASKMDSSGRTWYQIQYTSSKKGWVMASLGKLINPSATTAATKATTKPSTVSTTAKTTTATTTTTKKAETVKKVVITGNPVNVRSGVGTSFSKIGSTSKGAKFTWLATKKDASGQTWYQIQYTSSKKGWVMGSLSKIDDGTSSTPGQINGRVAYLTFDDGPSVNTFKILDILDQYNVKATFFVIYHKNMEKQYQAIVSRGHTIALHSYTHEYSDIYSSERAYFNDLNKIHDYVENVTGVDSNIIRFPGGSSNTVSNRYCRGLMKTLKQDVPARGYIYHDWNVDSTDASGNNRKASLLLSNVKSGMRSKPKTANILMHDTGRSKNTTVEALPSIIEYIQSQGYAIEPITVDSKVIQHH